MDSHHGGEENLFFLADHRGGDKRGQVLTFPGVPLVGLDKERKQYQGDLEEAKQILVKVMTVRVLLGTDSSFFEHLLSLLRAFVEVSKKISYSPNCPYGHGILKCNNLISIAAGGYIPPEALKNFSPLAECLSEMDRLIDACLACSGRLPSN